MPTRRSASDKMIAVIMAVNPEVPVELLQGVIVGEGKDMYRDGHDDDLARSMC